MKRTFIAIQFPLPSKFEKCYRDIQSQLSTEPVKWVPLENLHITLNFLGGTSPEMQKMVIDLLNKTVIQFKTFTVNLNGFGGFPSLQRPKVLWFGLQYEETLPRLQEKLSTELEKLGFEADKRRFNPHLTIARIKGPFNYELLSGWGNDTGLISEHITITRVIYFESILRGNNPAYKPLHIVELGK